MDYEGFIAECDGLIKTGKISVVSERVRSLVLLQVPRKFRMPLGKICRRAGMIEQGLRLLHPIIRQEHSLEASATAPEICEYAVLLSRNGSISEAIALLKTVSADEAPEAMLYLGFCRVSQWDYPEAATCFENYLQVIIDPYSKLIASVNLAAAYIANQKLQEAEKLLKEIIVLAEKAGATRLVGNAYELCGQVAFFQKDFAKSRAQLARANSLLNPAGSYDSLLVMKWLTAMEAFEQKSVQPLLQFREKAVASHHWESVRDIDFYRLQLAFDQSTFDHLLFGTPSQAYHARIQREIAAEPSRTYLFGTETGPQFDLSTGELHGTADDEVTGKKIHQMLSILFQDFYAPQNVGSFFAELYPDEYFDINSSPLRVRQVLSRTRRWMQEHRLPLELQQQRGSYKLFMHGEFGVKIHFASDGVNNFKSQWQKILFNFSNAPFTAAQAEKTLGLSRSSFHRLLTWALEHQLIQKSGANRSTKYQVLVHSLKSAA